MDMTLIESSKAIGMQEDYFSTIKCNYKTIYRFFRLYGRGNLIEGKIKFQIYKDNLQRKVTDLYFSYETPREFYSHFPKDKKQRRNLRISCEKIITSKSLIMLNIKKAKQILRIEAYKEKLKETI